MHLEHMMDVYRQRSKIYYWEGTLIHQSLIARIFIRLAMWWDDIIWEGGRFKRL